MTQMPTTAMVLAAGLGTRMRPLTDKHPKPLINVAGKALMDYALDRFAAAGVEQAIVNVHYLADQIEAHLAARTAPAIEISDERGLLLETGGGLKKARPLLGDAPVFCTNTDAIMLDTENEACAMIANAWRAQEMDALLLLCPIAQTSGYDGKGDFFRNDGGHITFRGAADNAPFVFTGLQIISPALIDEGPEGAFSTKLLWEKARARGRLHGVVYDGFWMHVGDAPGLAAAEQHLTLRS